jgi:alkyl hydroperoxide reductase subunit AhpF
MSPTRLRDLIKNRDPRLTKPVRLVLFTSETARIACTGSRNIAQEIKAHFGKIALESYDLIMDRDKSQQYGITQVPALVVEAEDGRTITFCGLMKGIFLDVLLNTIIALSGSKPWLPDEIRLTLEHLAHDVRIRMFVEKDCILCRSVAEIGIGMALENGLINMEIIVASDFPELVKKQGITLLPKTIFGENLHMDGHVTETEFLEMIFQAEGIKPGGDRRCLVCAKASQEAICAGCKTRIQAEALEYKLKSEKQRQPESL